MSKWPIKKIGEVVLSTEQRDPTQRADVEFVYVDIGSVDNTSKEIRGATRVLGALAPSRARKVIREGDVIVATVRPSLNAVALVPGSLDDEICSTGFCVLRANKHLNKRYLFYFAQSASFVEHLVSRVKGANYPAVTENDVRDAILPLPPLSEQERIVQTLDEAEDLRRLRAQADINTAKIASAHFHELFEDSVDGKTAWRKVKLADECDRITVGHVGPMTSEYVEKGVPFLRGLNIKRGRIDLSDVQYISEDFHARLSKSALRPGDVVSVRTGKPGTTAVVPDSLSQANCADLIVMTPSEALEPAFLAELLNLRLGDQENLQHSVGAAQQHFNIGEARRIEFSLPPHPSQRAFAAHVAEIRELQASQAASRQRLDALFHSLLRRAFQGDL